MSIKTVVLTFALLSLSHSSFAGVRDSGGGNGIGSSTEEVSSALVDAKLKFGVFVHMASFDNRNILNPANVKNKRAQKILRLWLQPDGNNESIVLDNINTEYKPQAGDCPSNTDNDHDASTAHKKRAPICFSTTSLSRFPKWTLEAELVALAAHEHAHHFGFGEEDARAIQGYIFNVYGFLEVQEKLSEFRNQMLQNYRSRVSTGYSPAGSPLAIAFAEEVCRSYAVIEGIAVMYGLERFKSDSRLDPVCKPTQFDPDLLENRIHELEDATVSDFNSN